MFEYFLSKFLDGQVVNVRKIVIFTIILIISIIIGILMIPVNMIEGFIFICFYILSFHIVLLSKIIIEFLPFVPTRNLFVNEEGLIYIPVMIILFAPVFGSYLLKMKYNYSYLTLIKFVKTLFAFYF
ncbi:hypothetical protein M0P65_02185 [Candidatus Gracilibacteria bacterium]|nr:hypothetical protein [Candidatus Gracilibacteria bacterium]